MPSPPPPRWHPQPEQYFLFNQAQAKLVFQRMKNFWHLHFFIFVSASYILQKPVNQLVKHG